MTTAPYHAEPLSGRLPREDERESANMLRRVLAEATLRAKTDDEPIELDMVIDAKPAKIVLHHALSDLLLETLRMIGAGDAVTLVPVHRKLSTQQAADILNVSRPYLVKLLESDEIPFETVGRHRRVLARDIFDYRTKRARKRDAALATLAENDADMI